MNVLKNLSIYLIFKLYSFQILYSLPPYLTYTAVQQPAGQVSQCFNGVCVCVCHFVFAWQLEGERATPYLLSDLASSHEP